MAVGQRQRLHSGVRMFTGNYLSSTPRDLREWGVELVACGRWLKPTASLASDFSRTCTGN
jgi:hypothetical protein